VSDLDRTPFRRFPWVQLGFCLACLAMTAWTWMRYSYVWDVPAEKLSLAGADGCSNPYDGSYVRLHGLMGIAARGNFFYLSVCYDVAGMRRGNSGNYESVRLQPYGVGVAPSGPVKIWGRLVVVRQETDPDGQAAWLELDMDASRFTWQSMAGLMVGAMGCLIFGLYLLRWRDRADLVTNAEPAPAFQHFPWLQLAFCLACLSMTTWTWMRYSYCWEAGPTEAWLPRPAPGWPNNAYVHLSARATKELALYLDDHDAALWVGYTSFERAPDDYLDNLAPNLLLHAITMADNGRTARGRIKCMLLPTASGEISALTVDASYAERLTGASVAGIVVGAMGCFIFGLYLRRWLRERKATADGLHH